MIYEMAYVLRTEANEEAIKNFAEIVTKTITEYDGETLLTDDWGVKTFAQPTSNGIKTGHYFYVMYKSNNTCNVELQRRCKISEDVLKFIFVSLGVEAKQEEIVKAYKNPGHITSEGKFDAEKERKMFAKRKSCWFSAKKCKPDWKDTTSYSWMVNEFGKISPARVTALRPRYQTSGTTAIKRGRCMGLISYLSSDVAR